MTRLAYMRRKVENDAREGGYYLNPDKEFLNNLIEGLDKNDTRYGYPSCPCRLSSGKTEFDRDIICPCDYRDQDIEEYGSCYCSLFVNKDAFEGKSSIVPIPERRPLKNQIRTIPQTKELTVSKNFSNTQENKIQLNLYYCKQCGYLCYREEPPYKCPICKAKKDMFLKTKIQCTIV